jgi:hypothetical protein
VRRELNIGMKRQHGSETPLVDVVRKADTESSRDGCAEGGGVSATLNATWMISYR